MGTAGYTLDRGVIRAPRDREDPDGVPAPPLGDVVRLAPNHVCWAVNLADDLVVTQNGIIDHWVVAARGANT
ncbi:hypothetical protein [Pseudarthrobacter sp. Y6]|uniref:hypothetical protein n=1 Tax=Pseudarthrobacter sp. Y6 TaxID=3418422 RepID=UPI003CF42C2E